MVTIKEKNKSQLLGDIVVIKTETVKESLSEHVLQIKFEKKNIPYPYNTNWTCVYWDIESKIDFFLFQFYIIILVRIYFCKANQPKLSYSFKMECWRNRNQV